MPKISVVLPVYNGEKYLKASIESVLAQTFQDFELIIIDDCSTDNSGDIAQVYANLDDKVRCFTNPQNLKLPESLNQGFLRAKGEYLTWTSCDNIYLPNAFKIMNSILDADASLGIVYADREIIDSAGNVINYSPAGSPDDIIIENVVGCCFMYRKDVALRTGIYNKNIFLCEDYEYWLRIGLHSKLKPINQCLYQYRMHDESLSHNYTRLVIERGIAVQKKYYPFYVKSRFKAAQFYAFLRARDIYNPWRQFYLLYAFLYSPSYVYQEVKRLVSLNLKKIFSE